MDALSRALRDVHERIEGACARAGRAPESVRLVAVSKTFPSGRVREAIRAGQTVFGENRVQEALDKIAEVGPGPEWHLIGHLQRNKARHVAGAFALIHGVDGERLAREIDRRAAAREITQPILLQVRLGGETSKAGIDEADLQPLVDTVLTLPNLDLRGLMTIPPPARSPEDNRRWFARLRGLAAGTRKSAGSPLPELSMGMTDDFEVAVEEGATLVRVGRAIFGER